jgi:hypothetical protein
MFMATHTPATEFGYQLYPPHHPGGPGYARIDVILRQQPSQHHFDPEQIHVLAASPDGIVEALKLSHPWLGVDDWQLCAGQVDLLDRKGKHVDFFTFGGDLHVEKVDETRTLIVLSSEAPFLMAQPHTSAINLLIQEVEIQMAQLRAEWCRSDGSFDECLACLNPFDLYRMCLVAILQRIGQWEYDETVFKLRHLIQDELAIVGNPTMSLVDLKV